MKVRILEKRLSTGTWGVLSAGDVIVVPRDIGKTWCQRGWAEDVAGIVPTGERIVSRVVVVPKSVLHGAKDSNLKT